MESVSYVVMKNQEDQYSIWPSFKAVPTGWEALGEPASREDCLAYIKRHWTDVRPRSLRERMERAAGKD
jgi:MbtH protein